MQGVESAAGVFLSRDPDFTHAARREDPATGPIRAMTIDPNTRQPRDGDDRAWDVSSEARETFERVSSLQLEELMRSAAGGVEATGRTGRGHGNGFAMPEDSDESDDDDDESDDASRDAGEEREDLEDVDDVERGAERQDDEDDEPDATGEEEPQGDDDAADADDDDDDDQPEPFEDVEGEEEEERKTRARLVIIRLRDEAFASDPHFKKRTVAQLNAEAVAFLKRGDDLRCVAAFAKVFRKLRDNHLVHKDLHVCHSNRAAAYLNLGLFEEALWDAMRCQKLADERFWRDRDAISVAPIYVKAFARRGFALMGLRNPRQAKLEFEKGLRMNPEHAECKRGMEEATQAMLADLMAGRGKETLALPASSKVAGRITTLPHAAPLHHIHPRDMLPVRLLTPFQADNDYHVKDTYNYVTVQADMEMPKRHFRYLEDTTRRTAFADAVTLAVDRLREDAKDARVLNIGCGAGLVAMEALRAGAHHVTATDRWLYHAMAAKESLLNNGFSDDQVKVVYKRPTDLAVLRDVPISCNLCVNDMLDDGLLASGIIPSFRHALEKLLLPDAILLPASATVHVMPVEMRVDTVCGLDVSAMNPYRFAPTHTSAVELATDAFVPLAPPVEAWHFDFQNPPEESQTKTVDLAFERDGKFNAVVFWFTLNLIDDIKITTAPLGFAPGEYPGLDPADYDRRPTSLHPAVQFLEGEMEVKEGGLQPMTCVHNTVCMQFRVEEAEYLHLHRRVASFPQYHFGLLRDEERARAYDAAIRRQVERAIAGPDGCAKVLDIGAGSGLLSMMAARAGATKVIACEWHSELANCCRRNVALNKMSGRVTVANCDSAKLQRGKVGVPVDGCNVVVVDMFDAGLTGEHVLFMLEKARVNLTTTDCAVVPAAATLYCMGVEAYTSEVSGFDMSSFNKYRWDKTYDSVRMKNVPHRILTRPKKAFELFLDGSKGKGRGRESVLRMETIASGYLNAIVFWFDLHMDEKETITTAPPGVGKGGVLEEEQDCARDAAELAARRARRDARAKEKMIEAINRHKETLASNPRTDLGERAFAERAAAEAEAKAAAEAGAEGGAAAADAAKEIIPAWDQSAADDDDDEDDGPSTRHADRPEHYWGQALQYLERGVQVKAKKKVTLLAKREMDRVTFSLKEGVGGYVGKPPWRIEWGGGASVESPHFQRVHYCELLVSDYLMRLKGKRFPPIEKEMRMILAHCGSLFLDPAVIQHTMHRFACLELVHDWENFSAGASMEALTKKPLLLY